jgi:neutral ceramidase
MTRKRKILLLFAGTCATFVALVVTLVGPWPTYKSGYADKAYYQRAIAAIGQRVPHISPASAPGRFQAGWSSCSLTPPVGTPLAGYGDRKGRPSSGVHDELYVKALAVSDGRDNAVIVGSDLLIVPENVAERVRVQVAERTALTAHDILFTASHNHSGPGAFAPGLASQLFNGPYDPNMPGFLADAFCAAIVAAFESLAPAKLTHGSVDVPEYIRNRERAHAPVDSELSFMLVEQDGGERCFVVSYSAHPTILGGSNMEFSGEYPGFLMRCIQQQTGAEAMYLGGAVGSMSHRAPAGADPFARSQAMGEALARKVLEAAEQAPPFQNEIDVASVGIPIQLPPYQMRINAKWRVSKFLLPILGVDTDAWMQALRIGDMVLVGTPADYCGEISVKLKSWAEERSNDLWVLSFNGDYVGYISPDAYYNDLEENGGLGYERGTMSWIGPDQEALSIGLIRTMVDVLFSRQ